MRHQGTGTGWCWHLAGHFVTTAVSKAPSILKFKFFNGYQDSLNKVNENITIQGYYLDVTDNYFIRDRYLRFIALIYTINGIMLTVHKAFYF